jgi:hypothetical protein
MRGHNHDVRIQRWLGVGGGILCTLCLCACAKDGRATIATRMTSSTVMTGEATAIAGADWPSLVPPNEVGSAGWCVKEPNGGGCEEARVHEPVLVQSWSSEEGVEHGYALTTREVLAVSVGDGRHIATQGVSALPDGLRAVGVEIRGAIKARRRGAIVGAGDVDRVRFTPFNAAGRKIPERLTNVQLAVLELPTRAVASGHPTEGECRIEGPEELAGVTVANAVVIAHVAPLNNLLAGAMMVCATTRYREGHDVFAASVLLDASEPGHAPVALPGMRGTSGHAGTFEAPAVGGDMAARRIGGGWLVVSGGSSFDEQLSLLEHLRAAVVLTR